MKVIGLTGGIGSGKSMVAGILEKFFSMKVLYADDIAKEQMQKGGMSYEGIVKAFGSEILAQDGEIDRDLLSHIIYADEDKKNIINGLVHPGVRAEILDVVETLRELNTFSAVFVETALLIEAKYYEFCDEVWYVYATEDERRERLVKYRGMDTDKIRDIFASQCSEEEFRNIATRVINNSDEVTVSDMFEQISECLSSTDF